MKIFLHTSIVTILVISQSGSFANKGYRCCHSSSDLDKILKEYLCKWGDSNKSMGSSVNKYQKSVLNQGKRESCECASKDVNTANDGATEVINQVSRITDGCGQTLRQAIITVQYIERLAINKKSEKACNALGESIEVISLAAKRIQICQDKFHDNVTAELCRSTSEIDKICSKNIGDEIFFNYAKLSFKISALTNDFEECKAKVLQDLSDKLNALLDLATSCSCQ